MTPRLLEATPRQLLAMTGSALKASIAASEGRTLAVEVIASVQPPVTGVTNGEIAAAFGADLIILDQYDPLKPTVANAPATIFDDPAPLGACARLFGRPVGFNLIVAEAEAGAFLGGRLLSEASLERALAQGGRIINIYMRPQIGGTHEGMIAGLRLARRLAADEALLIGVPTFTRPAPRTPEAIRAFIADAMMLIEAGADGIALPLPGSKQGWTIDAAGAIVDAVRAGGALAWLFLTGSIEGASEQAMTQLALAAKQSGADACRLDEAGLSGMPVPENILAFSLALRGRAHTFRRMAASPAR